MDIPSIPKIKIKLYTKSYKGYVSIKLCINTMSEKSGTYELEMAMLDNIYPEEFFYLNKTTR